MTPHYLRHVTKPLNFPLLLSRMKERIYTRIGDLEASVFKSPEPVPFAEAVERAFEPISVGDRWGNLFDCAWFRIRGVVPEAAEQGRLALVLDINGEGCVYDRKGHALLGLTCGSSVFDRALGSPVKRVFPLPESRPGEPFEYYIDGGNNDLFGNFQAQTGIKELSICTVNEPLRKLYYDALVLYELAGQLGEESARCQRLLHVLNKVQNTLSPDFTAEEIASAEKLLSGELAKRNGDADLIVDAVGHAHIDLAWLWPIRETKRKIVRTFATQLNLIERYPGYVFTVSQAQQLAWLKEDAPDLYARVKEQVTAGRIEIQGGTWVESDTYLPSGESLIRQFLYGKAFFREEFGKDPKTLWLPDAFGYTAMMPQIAVQAGMESFLTTKLSWSAYDQFSFSSFVWRGEDGSELVAHLPPELTYNGAGTPESVRKIEKNNLESGVFGRALMLFGIGDGGGGPAPAHLEHMIRMENLSGQCPVVMRPSAEFFGELARVRADLPVYRGELYVQNHQGCLTSVGMVKYHNRRLERLLRQAETLCAFAEIKKKRPYPAERLGEIWREALLYQFHDILPGSSIRRVYEECQLRYEALEAELEQMILCAHEALIEEKRGKTLYNFAPYENRLADAAVAPLSNLCRIEVRGAVVAEGDLLENERLRVRFGAGGEIVSFYDKQLGFECVRSGGAFNRLTVYNDQGDAWDMSIAYPGARAGEFRLLRTEARVENGSAVRESVYSFGESALTQRAVLEAGSCVLRFEMTVDYREKDRMLRADFDCNLHSDSVLCDMQFGSYRRQIGMNSTWDFARFEMCGHRFAALTGGGRTIAVLSDCKYGYRAAEDFLSLNLIRCKGYPGDYFDVGVHRFTYGVTAAAADDANAPIERAAYCLGEPVLELPGQAGRFELVRSDCPNVVPETFKRREDGEGYVLRLYENRGLEVEGELRPALSAERIRLADALEREGEELGIADGKLRLHFRPHEIKTLSLRGVR